ncbi:MAG: valine--tRNA ligase [Candidatus Margulisbacteria bacterium]|nr:valine--tRNA ligase [Candidatus Margulisiibacteriota bacterium]
MEKNYNHENIEDKWYKLWEDNKYFAPKTTGKPFSMVIPPPNVTGALHLGHALDNTLQDIIARYHRLKGDRVLWVPGTDHAGIATQNVVEKELKKQGIHREELGREKFIERVWQWKEEYGTRITSQLRKLGASLDWDHERFTMDEGLSEAVKENFVRLYDKKLLYRDTYIVNWCPRCHTAISDIEVDHKDEHGHLWHIRYPLADNPAIFITVATTRPETMFGDTAVAVNPSDERYSSLIGQELLLPLTKKRIPIIADHHVDQNFGTGAVKVTPAHDPNDFQIGIRHKLEKIIVMDTNGVMNENSPKPYQKMDRYVARKQIIKDLESLGLLEKTEDHDHAVGHCYRCDTTIEPYLSKQWFIDMKQLVEKPISTVKNKDIQFLPERWEKLYFDWMENIRPWCISRQIWWGHRIPVWYCQDCNKEIVSKIEVTTCSCGSKNVKQDEDVLDTWFSSALWPFSTLGWPEQTQDLKDFYPTSVLVTGYDIITFWVSRMITMGLFNMSDVPFRKVYIHGLVRDAEGRKMSKSLGNVIDPLIIIQEKGADVLRFTLASLVTSGGQDIRLMDDKLVSSRNFINKLWNVSRYILMQEAETTGELGATLADKWILSAFKKVTTETDKYYDNFEFNFVVEKLYEFVWNEFCDWYIEMSKQHKQASQPTLIYVLNGILKLLHPIIPFITEEIWQQLKVHPLFSDLENKSIMLSAWPEPKTSSFDDSVFEEVKILIKEIRNIKAEKNIAGNKKGNLIVCSNTPKVAEYEPYITTLAGLETTTFSTKKTAPQEQHAYAVISENTVVYLPLAGLIDTDKEKEKLQREADKISAVINGLETKLNNKGFTDNAPAEVIEKQKNSLTESIAKLKLIETKLSEL